MSYYTDGAVACCRHYGLVKEAANGLRLYDPLFAAQQKAMHGLKDPTTRKGLAGLWSRIPPQYRAGLVGAGVGGVGGGTLGYLEAATQGDDFPNGYSPWEQAAAAGLVGAGIGGLYGFTARDALAQYHKDVSQAIEPLAPKRNTDQATTFYESLRKDMPGVSDKRLRAKTHPDVTQHNPDLDPEFMRQMFEQGPTARVGETNKQQALRKIQEIMERQKGETFPNTKELNDAITRFNTIM